MAVTVLKNVGILTPNHDLLWCKQILVCNMTVAVVKNVNILKLSYDVMVQTNTSMLYDCNSCEECEHPDALSLRAFLELPICLSVVTERCE
jgi:hypothetical protein